MLEQVAALAEDQVWRAWDEADEDGTWYTQVRFLRWGFAERFIVTAGQWVPF